MSTMDYYYELQPPIRPIVMRTAAHLVIYANPPKFSAQPRTQLRPAVSIPHRVSWPLPYRRPQALRERERERERERGYTPAPSFRSGSALSLAVARPLGQDFSGPSSSSLLPLSPPDSSDTTTTARARALSPCFAWVGRGSWSSNLASSSCASERSVRVSLARPPIFS